MPGGATVLLSVQLLNPWMLGGVAALAVPLLIHLLTRHTPRTVSFPTLQFLRRALARQSRIMRLRHLLLLLLRLLIVALLVIAFARPLLTLPFQRLRPDRGQTATMIAIDVSLSMDYQSSGTTPLARAKAEAVNILQSLQNGDQANILFVSTSTASAAPRMTRDLGLLREEIENARQTLEEADFNAAVNRAVQELDRPEVGELEKELYVISDFQRTNWAAVRLETVPADVQLYLVDVDTGPKRNAAITAVHTRPSAARLGDVIDVACDVANFSPEPREIPVTLDLGAGDELTGNIGAGNGRVHAQQRVMAPALGSATALFRVRLNQVGDYGGTLRIPPDALPADDVRYVSVRVRKALSLCLLTDENPADATTGAFYLVRALSPAPSPDASLRVTVLNGQQALARDLRGADVIFISNLASLKEDLGRRLHDYLANGGSVFYFIGGSQADAQLAALDRVSPADHVSPFTVGDLLDLKGLGRGYVTWTYARFESPMLKLFREPEFGNLSDLKFYKYRLVTATDDRAEVLLRYEDGTVAAARSRVGPGSFVLCNFSPHPLFADMMKHQIFPPLLHELVKGAVAEDATPQDFLVGQTASVGLDDVAPAAERSLTFQNPQGQPTGARWQRVGATLSVLFENAQQPGFYRVQSNGRRIAALPVNVSPRESDVRELDGAELAAKQKMERRSYTVRADTDPTHVERLRHGRELYHLFFLAALVAALMEQTLAYLLRTN